jgi:GDP-4-dehydro-6-deoxy-D-mannose reductase
MAQLVTGAEGFIGSFLVEHLLDRGEEVVATYFNESELWRLEGVRDRIQAVPVDVRDAAAVDSAVERFRPDALFHLAAKSLPSYSWDHPTITMETNVLGTVNVFESLRRHAPDAVVLVACSSAEYGAVTEDEVPTPEDHRLMPLHPYGVSKVAQDLLAYQYHANHGTRALRARIFNTTGPRKENDVLSDLVRRVVAIERGDAPPRLRVGNVEPRRDFTDVRDLVRALRSLVERGAAGEAYNVCSGNVHRVSDLLQLILDEAREEVEVHQDVDLMRPSDEPIIAGSNDRLVRATGWSAEISVERTIADMLDFWRSR